MSSRAFGGIGHFIAPIQATTSAMERRHPRFRELRHYACPTYAKAAMTRRDNLKRSAEELTGQLDDAKAALGEAFEELKKVELLDERDQLRERAVEEAREQAEFDRIGLVTVRGGLPA